MKASSKSFSMAGPGLPGALPDFAGAEPIDPRRVNFQLAESKSTWAAVQQSKRGYIITFRRVIMS